MASPMHTPTNIADEFRPEFQEQLSIPRSLKAVHVNLECGSL